MATPEEHGIGGNCKTKPSLLKAGAAILWRKHLRKELVREKWLKETAGAKNEGRGFGACGGEIGKEALAQAHAGKLCPASHPHSTQSKTGTRCENSKPLPKRKWRLKGESARESYRTAHGWKKSTSSA